VASTLHTTSEHGVSSITTADANTSAASSRLNWRPRRFKWTRPFRRWTKSGFCACAITFQTQSTYWECVFVALVIQHVMRVRRITLSSVARLCPQNFCTLSRKRHDFRKEVNEREMCFDFLYNFRCMKSRSKENSARCYKCPYVFM